VCPSCSWFCNRSLHSQSRLQHILNSRCDFLGKLHSCHIRGACSPISSQPAPEAMIGLWHSDYIESQQYHGYVSDLKTGPPLYNVKGQQHSENGRLKGRGSDSDSLLFDFCGRSPALFKNSTKLFPYTIIDLFIMHPLPGTCLHLRMHSLCRL
jgi:hypothetical protein